MYLWRHSPGAEWASVTSEGNVIVSLDDISWIVSDSDVASFKDFAESDLRASQSPLSSHSTPFRF